MYSISLSWIKIWVYSVVMIIDCVVVITRNTPRQSFTLTIVTCCFWKVPWKHFSFIFLLHPEKDITGSSSSLKLSILNHFQSALTQLLSASTYYLLFIVYLDRDGCKKNIGKLKQSSDVCIIVFLAEANLWHLSLAGLLVQIKSSD